MKVCEFYTNISSISLKSLQIIRTHFIRVCQIGSVYFILMSDSSYDVGLITYSNFYSSREDKMS